MFLNILLLSLSICFLLTGLIGCILPVIPGPPLTYIALLLLQATRFANFSSEFLLITAAITVVVTLLDYLLPVWGAKKWGGSRMGAIGAVIGLLAGLFFPPVGIIAGPFLGAVAFELLAGRKANSALRSGFGSFIGFLLGTGVKLAVCVAFTFYFIKELLA